MSRTDMTPPKRLREQREVSPLAGIVAQLRQQDDDQPLSQIELARVRARLDEERHERQHVRRGWLPGLRFATLAIVLLLGASAGATATFLALRPHRPEVITPPPPAVQPRARRAAKVKRPPLAMAAPVAVESPASLAAQKAPSVVPAARLPRHRPRVHAPLVSTEPSPSLTQPLTAQPPPLVPDPAAVEATLVGQALRLLQEPNGFDLGLRQLEGYLAARPRGVFAGEARTALITALARRDRTDEALNVLERGAHEGSMDLQLLHAELLVTRDCARSRGMFARLKAGARSQSEDERVDFGYARALQACGRDVELERALRLYQSRHPQGPHIETVNGWLEKRSDATKTP